MCATKLLRPKAAIYAHSAMCCLAALARALIPRSVTVALALPIGAQLDAPAAICAAAVLLHVSATTLALPALLGPVCPFV